MEKVGIDLIEHLDADLYDNHVICLKELGVLGEALVTRHEDKPIPGLKNIVSLDKPDGFRPSVLVPLIKYFLKHRIRIVHTNNSAPHFWAGIAASMCGIRVRVHTNHGRNADCSAKQMLLDRISARLSSRVVFVSEDTAEKIMSTDHIVPNKITIIPNGIDTNMFTPPQPSDHDKRRQLLLELGISKGVRVIGSIARFSTDKDQVTLIRAFAKLVDTEPSVRLLLVGDGETKGELEALTQQLGITGLVVFTGFRSDIIDILRILDIYVLPSHTEGLSISLLEAMATERAVVASDVGGNGEIVQHNSNGLLVAESDVEAMVSCLNSILIDASLAERISKSARQTVLNSFSITAMVKQYQQLYINLSA
ncbi:MAG: glycosyltransferase involved in cell wall biosynthesis [Paraglaciecola sp.]|jgi:glycosyltransferase involved in cell wall biosynthesis